MDTILPKPESWAGELALARLIREHGIEVECPQVDDALRPTGSRKHWLYIIRECGDESQRKRDEELLARLPDFLDPSLKEKQPLSETLFTSPGGEESRYTLACEIPDAEAFDASPLNAVKTKIKVSQAQMKVLAEKLEKVRGELHQELAHELAPFMLYKWMRSATRRDPEKYTLAQSLLKVDCANTNQPVDMPKGFSPFPLSLFSGEIASDPSEGKTIVLLDIPTALNALAHSSYMARQVESLHNDLPIYVTVAPKSARNFH